MVAARSRCFTSVFKAVATGVAGVGMTWGNISCQTVKPSTAPAALALAIQGRNPANGVVSAKDALVHAQAGTYPRGGNEYIRRIVDLVDDAQDIPLGAALTKEAADRSVTYGVHNNAPYGAGYYFSPFRLISFSFVNDNGKYPYDLRSAKSYSMQKAWMQDTLYHEIVHVQQYHGRRAGYAPAGTRSFDKGVWAIAMEAEARMVAELCLHHHQRGPFTPRPQELYNRFVHFMRNADGGHLRSYGFAKGKLDDGKKLDLERFIAVFGICPVTGRNYMAGRIDAQDHEAFYKVMVKGNATMRGVYEKECARLQRRAPAARTVVAPAP